MFNGYMTLGGETFSDTRFELVNTGRALAYVEGWNAKVKAAAALGPSGATACIDWLRDCDSCEMADLFFSEGAGYVLPETDPAPWYDPAIRDSERFLGVIGLKVTGAEDSTRSAEVTQSIAGGGVVGRLRYAPRTFVVSALAIAVDGCGLEVGLNWLRQQYTGTEDDCGGDHLWVLDCCPDCVPDPDAPPEGPCWPESYGGMIQSYAVYGGDATSEATDPEIDGGGADTVYVTSDELDGGNAYSTYDGDAEGPCPPGTWWPTTYQELIDGPPYLDGSSTPTVSIVEVEEEPAVWCAWVSTYYELRDGLPEFSCDIGKCIRPYVRNYLNVRVIDGPTVLRRQTMSTVGEIAEIEFTIVAADPYEYSPFVPLAEVEILPMIVVEDEPAEEPVIAGGVAFPDAFDAEPALRVLRAPRDVEEADAFARRTSPRIQRRTRLIEPPTKWVRHEFSIAPRRITKMESFVPCVSLTATEDDVGAVRVGLWCEGELVDGFSVPFVPAGGTVRIDGRTQRTTTEHGGRVRPRDGFAVGFGGGVLEWKRLPFPEHGLQVSVDQEFGKSSGLVAHVSMAEKGTS